MKPSKLAGCNVRTQKDPPKPERNHPCPCLSGKKYKKCCGDPAWLSQKRKEDDARFFAALKKKEEERKAEQEAALSERPHLTLGMIRRRMGWGIMFDAVYAIALGGDSLQVQGIVPLEKGKTFRSEDFYDTEKEGFVPT